MGFDLFRTPLVLLATTLFAAQLLAKVSADGCATGGICEGFCSAGLNPCYDAAGSQLTCCTSSCNNCNLATGQPPATVLSMKLYTRRSHPGPRQGAFDITNIDGGFSFNEDIFSVLPADLDNPKPEEILGTFQVRCVVTAIGELPFDAPASFECEQSFYFVIDGNGSYTDSISFNAANFMNDFASQPGAITGGAGKYKYIRGDLNFSDTVTSASGNENYDGLVLTYLLS